MKQPPLKRWKVAYALDVYGSIEIAGNDEEEVKAKFEHIKESQLFKQAAVKRIRRMGVITPNKKK